MIVVSWPPCWVALEANTLPTLPTSAPFIHRPAGLVPEVAHLGGHVAEAGRRAEDDRVVVGELVAARDRRRLVELEVRLLGDLLGAPARARA